MANSAHGHTRRVALHKQQGSYAYPALVPAAGHGYIRVIEAAGMDRSKLQSI